jgi:type I restriction enzyme R subunit
VNGTKPAGKAHDQLNIVDWKVKQRTGAAVQRTIRFTLDDLPQEPYPEDIWKQKVGTVWADIFLCAASANLTNRAL